MTRTAKTYGGALYDLAQEEHLEDAILADLAGVRAVLDENPDYLRLLCTPSVPKEERRGLLDEAWRGNVHPYVLNFMKLLCDNGTLREAQTGKRIELSSRVDESLLGGVLLELPDRQLDGTVAYHLEEIQRILRNTVI